MKKLLCVAAVIAAALLAFGVLSDRTNAKRALFVNGGQDELELAKQISLGILRDSATMRAAGNPDEYKIKRVKIDELGMAHTHVQQVVGGVPVWEGEAIVHLKEDGELARMTDHLFEAVTVDTTPNLDGKRAFHMATEMFAGGDKITEAPEIDLYIFRAKDRDRLVWRVEIARLDGSEHTAAPVYFIDAHTGEKVFEYDNLQTGSGNSLYSGNVTISTSQSGSTYYMEDLTRRMGTFNMNNTGNTTTGTGGTQSRYTGTDDTWSAANERAGVDAHYGAAMTYAA